MPAATAQTNESTSLWSPWTEANDEQREHFQTVEGHKAWSRICGGCGEGDYLERKQRPTAEGRTVQGRGFPALPLPALQDGQVRHAFRTPASRVHVCGAATAASNR